MILTFINRMVIGSRAGAVVARLLVVAWGIRIHVQRLASVGLTKKFSCFDLRLSWSQLSINDSHCTGAKTERRLSAYAAKKLATLLFLVRMSFGTACHAMPNEVHMYVHVVVCTGEWSLRVLRLSCKTRPGCRANGKDCCLLDGRCTCT